MWSFYRFTCRYTERIISKQYEGGPVIAIFFLIVFIMTLIYLAVRNQERKMASQGFRRSNGVAHYRWSKHDQRQVELLEMVPIVGVFCGDPSHIVGRLWIRPLHNGFIFIHKGQYDITVSKNLADFFCPLQGFFNMSVLIYPRVASQLRANDDMHIFQAIVAAIQCKPCLAVSITSSRLARSDMFKASRRISFTDDQTLVIILLHLVETHVMETGVHYYLIIPPPLWHHQLANVIQKMWTSPTRIWMLMNMTRKPV